MNPLLDKFPKLVHDFIAYENKQDITSTDPRVLQAGSQNMFIVKTLEADRPSKLVPRGGMEVLGPTIFGTGWTDTVPIRSEFDKLYDRHGNILLIREYPAGGTLGDLIQVLVGNIWYNLTKRVTDLPAGTHKYRFEKWWDNSNLQNRLIMASGSKKSLSWSTGYAQVVSVGVNQLKLGLGDVWSAHGFIQNSPNFLTFNGVTFVISGGWNTDTLTLTSNPVGIINPGDYVFQGIRADDLIGQSSAPITNFNIDSITNYINHIVYEDFTNATIYYSQIQDNVSVIGETGFAGTGLDNANFVGTYNGTDQNPIYQVTIDYAAPNIQTFTPGGAGNLNGAVYDTSGYNGPVGVTNKYSFLIISNMLLIGTIGVGTFTLGERVIGSVSKAEGTIAFVATGGGSFTLFISLATITGFKATETITGSSSGATGTIDPNGVAPDNGYVFMRNGVKVISLGLLPQLLVPIPLVDGLVIQFPNYFGQTVGDSFNLEIGRFDTFSWFYNGIQQASTVPITSTAPIFLSNGVSIQFSTFTNPASNTGGHKVGDSFSATMGRAIIDSWKDVSFTQPSRLPGEGWIQILDAPPIDALPQEDSVYYNTMSGSWIKTTFTLSADLKSETITIKKLKSQFQNQLYGNGLINYDLNSIIYITQDNTVLSLGRLELLEEPQHKLLSDPVLYDFLNSDFTDGDIKLADSRVFFSVPKENKVFCYDLAIRRWQPPQVFEDPIGKMSIHNGFLVGHSYGQSKTYTLFSGTNDAGKAFTTRVVLPYNTYGGRDQQSQYNMTWTEGYVKGAPKIKFDVNRGYLGCQKTESHVISPILCTPSAEASLGSSSLGFHPLGSDQTAGVSKFREIWQFSSDKRFYEANMQLECSTLDQEWALISIGINAVDSSTNNSDLISNPKPSL